VKVEAQEEEEERRNVAIDVGGKNINMALNELAMINRHTQRSHLSFLPRLSFSSVSDPDSLIPDPYY
jgi:hypothetical protein